MNEQFSNLVQGDIIQGDRDYCVVRFIGGRAVIGPMCGCAEHTTRVFNDTFVWDESQRSLVGSNGQRADWLSRRTTPHQWAKLSGL